jgi:hypothetical protein
MTVTSGRKTPVASGIFVPLGTSRLDRNSGIGVMAGTTGGSHDNSAL